MNPESINLYYLLKPSQLRNALMSANHHVSNLTISQLASLVQPAFAPRTVDFDVRVTLPAGTPMVAVAQAMSQLAAAVGGTWRYSCPPGADHGRFEVAVAVEGRP